MNHYTNPDTVQEFKYIGLKMLNAPTEGSIHEQNRTFVELFGVKWHICAIIWQDIYPTLFPTHQNNIKTKHLLWCLLFMKRYSKGKADAQTAGVTMKTFRKWVWIVMVAIAECDSEWVSFLF